MASWEVFSWQYTIHIFSCVNLTFSLVFFFLLKLEKEEKQGKQMKGFLQMKDEPHG